ncbi:BrnT family toxin [Haliscomenobacter sp.]|uniref:BrnT family toxin n=1 Tax=Haliscomenobacter sp. TaxID=2717303 RepID=UPI003364FD47
MSNFEWDENKNRSNQQKHGIPFEEAKDVFDDDNAVAYPGHDKDGENRILLVGKTLGRFIIAVVFTMRKQIYRIISARQARKEEVRDYIANKFQNLDDESGN